MSKLSMFATIATRFEAVFLDQFGVLHDGHEPYPGAIDALKALRECGIRTVILSNSGKPGEDNARRMAGLGFARDLYDHFLTSGDVAEDLLRRGAIPLAARTRCLTISSSDEHDLADRLGFESVESGDSADLVLIAGSQGERISLDNYRQRLEPAARRGVPCLCTNPDRLALGRKRTFPGAGAIAEQYEALGGPVTWIGKPHAEIYAAAARLAGSPPPGSVLCIGDSVEHDIVGAHRFGASAVLVRTGIHGGLSETELAAELARHHVVPDFVLASLVA